MSFDGFAASLAAIFQSLGDYQTLPMRLGKGDADRTLWVSGNAISEVPGNMLAYVHIDPGDGGTLSSRPREFSTALNPFGWIAYGLPVITAESKNTNVRIVIGLDYDELPSFMAQTGVRTLPVAEQSHYLWGPGGGVAANPAWLDGGQVVNFKIHPKADYGLTVQWVGTANRSVYVNSSGEPVVLAGSEDVDLSGYVPVAAGKAVWVCISLDVDAATLTVTSGAEFDPTAGNDGVPPIIADVDAANMPAVPGGEVGIAYVYLEEGQTQIDHQHVRQIYNLRAGGSDSGCIVIKPNPISQGDETLSADCEMVRCGPIDITGEFDCAGQMCVI